MKKIMLIIVTILSCLCFSEIVYAGNYTVSSTTGTVFVGNKVTITVNVSNLAGKFQIVSSNGNVLSGGSSGIWIENQTKTFQFAANGIGSATISVIPLDVADLSTNEKYTVTKTIKINVISPSKNNYLSSIKVGDYSISPKFDKDTLEYNLEVENDVRSITIDATKEDSTASVKGLGEVSLEEGINSFEIVVTAQNGSKRTYTLNITVKELSPIEVVVNGSKYNVIRKKELLPEVNSYYKLDTIKIGDEEVPVYFNEISNITLVGLKNEAGESKLYMYENGEYKLYEEISFDKLYIQILTMDESLLDDGYTISKITVKDKSLAVYTKEGYSYPVLYGMNIQTGEKSLYKYDEKENTLQRMENITIENNEDLYFIIILSLFGFIILSYILFICLLLKKNKKSKKKIERKNDSETLLS